jgi:hypothetical protein
MVAAVVSRAVLAGIGLFIVCFVVVAQVSVAPALAQAGDPAKAEELIKQANDFRREGHDERALPLLRQAYEITRTPRTAAQLGLAELALGYWTSARDHLAEALAPAGSHPWVSRNRATIEEALAKARAHIAELTVDGAPAGAEVAVNGKVVGTLPLPGPLEVGEGRLDVELRAPGGRTAKQTLTLAGGARERVSLRLEPAVGASAAGAGGAATEPTTLRAAPHDEPAGSVTTSSAPAEGLPTWRRALPWTLLAAGAAAAAVGVWQHVAWRDQQSQFEAIRACGASVPMHGADPRCAGLYDNLTGDRSRALLGYGVGAFLAAGAAVAFIVNGSTAPAAEARVGLAAGPGELGLSYAGTF